MWGSFPVGGRVPVLRDAPGSIARFTVELHPIRPPPSRLPWRAVGPFVPNTPDLHSKGVDNMLRPLLLTGLFACCALAAAFTPAHAQWVADGAQLAAENLTQSEPRVVSDGDGGTILVWLDFRSGYKWDIYAQRLDPWGRDMWPAGGVVIRDNNYNTAEPDVVSDGAGGAIVVWRDYRSGVSWDIYAQRINATGAVLWGTDGVLLCGDSSDQALPSVAGDGSGGAIFVWRDYRSVTKYETYAQRVNAAGSTMWLSNGVLVATSGDNQYDAMVVQDGSGGAFVTWRNLTGAQHDIYAQQLDGDGTRLWTDAGMAITNVATGAYDPRPLHDGAGGLIVIWRDARSGNNDIYAQRAMNGFVYWGVNGMVVCDAPGTQIYAQVCSDGSNGVIVSWRDNRVGSYDVYAQRVDVYGNIMWTPNGVAACTAPGGQEWTTLVPDGTGGAILGWIDRRLSNSYHVYAQRLDASGNPAWTADGVALSTVTGNKTMLYLTPDGAGGAVLVWRDYRNPTYDIYGQRIERRGFWGYPSPVIAGVRDIPGDQGGAVNLSWDASRLDPWPDEAISHYSVWRAIAPQAMAQMQRASGRVISSPAEVTMDAPRGLVRVEQTAAGTYYWELLENVTAYSLPGYATTAPTHFDSTASSSEYHFFQVIAHGNDPGQWWESPPDSGYSVDNLAPAAPQNLAGAQETGTGGIRLTWAPNSEADLSHYTIYRGPAGFTPGPGNLVGESPDTFQVDGTWQWDSSDYYKVCAVDVHGNESVCAELAPTLVTGADPLRVPAAPSLSQNYPNPFGARTSISFGLTARAQVTLRVYDVRGRLVRTLVNAEKGPATHTLSWDGRDANGLPVAAGIYFYRLKAGAFTQTKKMVVVR